MVAGVPRVLQQFPDVKVSSLRDGCLTLNKDESAERRCMDAANFYSAGLTVSADLERLTTVTISLSSTIIRR